MKLFETFSNNEKAYLVLVQFYVQSQDKINFARCFYLLPGGSTPKLGIKGSDFLLPPGCPGSVTLKQQLSNIEVYCLR